MSLRYGGRQAPAAPQQRWTAQPHEILGRRPLQQAVDQMEPGEAGERGPWLKGYHSRDPIPTTTHLGHGERDLTGLRVDRLVVRGRIDAVTPNERRSARSLGARWLVRCDCGIYETRRAPSLKGRMRTDRAMCQRCDYVLHLRRQAHFDRNGRWPAEDYGRESLPTLNLPALVDTLPVNLTSPPDPADKGHKSKGDRAAQRRRARARRAAHRGQ